MAPKRTATHIPYPIFLTDTTPEPSDETGINSPLPSPTAFLRTNNMLGLTGVPIPAGRENGTAYKRADLPPTSETRKLVSERDNYDAEDTALADDDDKGEDQVLALVRLDLSRQGPPAIIRHGAFVAPLPETIQEKPPPRRQPLLTAHRRFGFIPFVMGELGSETLDTPLQCAVGPSSSAVRAKSGKGGELVQWREEEASNVNDGEVSSDPLAACVEEPESGLEGDLLDCEEKILSSLLIPTVSKRPSAPVLVQPRGDGQAEVRLVLDDEAGFLDDIEEYVNGEFDMYSFGALSEMMGSPVKSTSDWIEQAGAALSSLKPRDAQRMVDLCPVRPPDAFAGLADGEEAYRPPTPLGISESDEEELNRPMSPSGDGDSEVTAVENVSPASLGPSVPGTVNEVAERKVVNKEKVVEATSPSARGEPGPSARSTSISPSLTTLTASMAQPQNALTASFAQPALSLQMRATSLKRTASDADLDETKDVKGKGKAVESVKRQRLLLKKPSNASVESM